MTASPTNGKLRTRGNKTHLSGLVRQADAASTRSRRASKAAAPGPQPDAADAAPPIPTYAIPPSSTTAEARVYVGDCRDIISRVPECVAGTVDLVFADPPFNWKRAYDEWNDEMPHNEYLEFTFRWLDLCINALRPGGALWINIPDDWAAEIVMYLKYHRDEQGRYLTGRPNRLTMVNWCIWHYRFGQNTTVRFINSKVHALYFVKPGGKYTWNPTEVLELSDRRAIYEDPRTESKNDGMPAGLRVPMDVWYGKFWGRVQGNSKERRGYHDNQLPELYLARVIRACSDKGDLVMDPFLGSGTTGVVAHALARRFIGCEYSEKNATSAFERMKAGPVRDVHASGQSTAIFPHRRKGKAGSSVKRAAGLDGESALDSAENVEAKASAGPGKKRRGPKRTSRGTDAT